MIELLTIGEGCGWTPNAVLAFRFRAVLDLWLGREVTPW